MAATSCKDVADDFSLEKAAPAALKSRYKELVTDPERQTSYKIRVHRCTSWMTQAGSISAEHPEVRFIYLWIALNCLYSRWNETSNEPERDSPSRRDWIHQLCRLAPDVVAQALKRHRGLVKKILENPFLSPVFWRDPHHPKAKGRAAEDAIYIDRNLKGGQVAKVLEQLMDRLFVLRGQIIHGASTGGGRLNRKSLNDCLRMLETIVPVLAWVFVEYGSREKWPPLCYPPL